MSERVACSAKWQLYLLLQLYAVAYEDTCEAKQRAGERAACALSALYGFESWSAMNSVLDKMPDGEREQIREELDPVCDASLEAAKGLFEFLEGLES